MQILNSKESIARRSEIINEDSPPPHLLVTPPCLTFRILLIGESQSGKSHIRNHFEYLRPSAASTAASFEPTIGVDFSLADSELVNEEICSNLGFDPSMIPITIDSVTTASNIPPASASSKSKQGKHQEAKKYYQDKLKVQIFEMVGGSRFRMLTHSSLSRYDAVIVTYKIGGNNNNTNEGPSDWIGKISHHLCELEQHKSKLPVYVVGNDFAASSSSSSYDDDKDPSIQKMYHALLGQNVSYKIVCKMVNAKRYPASCHLLLENVIRSIIINKGLPYGSTAEAMRRAELNKSREKKVYKIAGFYPSVADFVAFMKFKRY